MGVWKGAIVCAVLLQLSQLVRLENSPRLFQQDDLAEVYGEYEDPPATDVPHNGAVNEIKTEDFADHGNPENDLTDVEHIDTEYNRQKRSSGNTPIRALHDYNKIKRSFFPKEEDVFSAYRMTRSPENTPIRALHDYNKIKRSFFPKEEDVFSAYRMTRSPENTPIKVLHDYNRIKRQGGRYAISGGTFKDGGHAGAYTSYGFGSGLSRSGVGNRASHHGGLSVPGTPYSGGNDRSMEKILGKGKVGSLGNGPVASGPYFEARVPGTSYSQGNEKILGNGKVGTLGNGPVVSGPYFGAQYNGGGNSNPREWDSSDWKRNSLNTDSNLGQLDLSHDMLNSGGKEHVFLERNRS